MSIAHNPEAIIQIGEEGGIWMPHSVAKKNNLKPTTTSNGELVQDHEPIPSVVSSTTPIIIENAFEQNLGRLETEIEIPRPVTIFLERVGDVLMYLSPKYTYHQIRKIMANS